MTYSNTLALGRRQSYPMKNRNVVSARTERRKLGPVSNTNSACYSCLYPRFTVFDPCD